eukprot:TRINITY_DN111600_c0_g1_i1.p1 TRINITY_DN111600_c0_g1~~TRINITY_DN111600_c0_g1_i1.p1  ORF type:complete len:333 (-),score=18.76 TRINITY_DN111600_c0_g1_i1:110-1108(-)
MLVEAPFSGCSFGAVISGVTVQDILKNSSLQEQLVSAFNEHGVLVLRGQTLRPQEEMALAKLFPHDADAPIEERAGPYSEGFRKWKLPQWPEIQVQGWGHIENYHGISGTMCPRVETREWHTDGIHDLRCPCVLTQIYCVSAPPVGGETLFASGYVAWEMLSFHRHQQLSRRIVHYKPVPNKMDEAGTRAQIGAATNVRNSPGLESMDAQSPDISASHPLFRRHPVTGRVALSVAPYYMHSITGVADSEEAAALVDELLQGAVAKMYAHKFQVGDLVLCDNRCMLHSASPTPHTTGESDLPGLRLLHRIRMSSKEEPLPAAQDGGMQPEENI